jgi:hypothetical protein
MPLEGDYGYTGVHSVELAGVDYHIFPQRDFNTRDLD